MGVAETPRRRDLRVARTPVDPPFWGTIPSRGDLDRLAPGLNHLPDERRVQCHEGMREHERWDDPVRASGWAALHWVPIGAITTARRAPPAPVTLGQEFRPSSVLAASDLRSAPRDPGGSRWDARLGI
jgi:hypothetical protein